MILDMSGEFAYEIEATPYGMSISVRVEKPTLEVTSHYPTRGIWAKEDFRTDDEISTSWGGG